MSDLRALVYVSSAAKPMGRSELDLLLLRARRRNQACDVTGALVYCDGNFMQFIEGPTTPLMRIYADICADQRHKDLIMLSDEPVAAREFTGWAMAYSPLQTEAFARLRAHPWAGRDAPATGVRSGGQLLRAFAQRHWPGTLGES